MNQKFAVDVAGRLLVAVETVEDFVFLQLENHPEVRGMTFRQLFLLVQILRGGVVLNQQEIFERGYSKRNANYSIRKLVSWGLLSEGECGKDDQRLVQHTLTDKGKALAEVVQQSFDVLEQALAVNEAVPFGPENLKALLGALSMGGAGFRPLIAKRQ